MLGFFLTDEFIKNTVNEIRGKVTFKSSEDDMNFQVIRINTTNALNSYFQTMLHYFEANDNPLKTILELKFKELLISIISNRENPNIARYFYKLAAQAKSSISYIMDQNFCYNLSLEEFAKLSHRSLSSFKRDFKKHYHTTPGRWLMDRRLQHAAVLLHNETTSITQVAFDCGFEDSSHFSRAFKLKYGDSPIHYRQKVS